MNSTKPNQITIRPIISYPREAEVGKTYLMTVDVQAVLEGVWPYPQEDYALHCILDAEPLFSQQSLGESTIVLNRFGGTYGPATFLLTAATTPQKGAVTVTLVNEQGLPLNQVTLPDINIVWERKKLVRIKKLEPDIPVPKPPQEFRYLNRSVAAIQNNKGIVVGTCFMVASSILVTCAHVVLGADSGPGQMISIRFSGGTESYPAKVLENYWRSPEQDDLAFLELDTSIPETLNALPLGDSTDSAGHEFVSFAYTSEAHIENFWISGQIRGLINGDTRLQLISRQIRRGMSGAPIVDKETGWVVGVINEQTYDSSDTAFAIPSERLRQIRPQLPWQTYEGSHDDSILSFPFNNLPPANPYFTGRQELISTIQSAFESSQSAVAITQAISGLGGVGKTQLALAYAHAHLDEYDLIWLLRADDESTLDGDLRQLGYTLQLPVQTADAGTARQMVLSWLSGTKKHWLLLYENADWIEPRNLRRYLPGGSGHILITSRQKLNKLAMQTLALDVFTSEEAVVFLQKRLRNLKKDSAITELTAELGYLPLALEQAAAYMETRGITPADYLRLFRERRQELWAREQPPEDYHATITTVWEIAFEITRQTPGAADLLNLCSFLAPDNIPLEMIAKHVKALPEALAEVMTNELARSDAIASLTSYSLLTAIDGVLAVHRLVQAMTRDRMGESLAQSWSGTAVDLLFEAYRFDLYDMTTWATAGQLIPHLRAASDLAYEVAGINTEHAAYLNNEIGVYFNHFGDYVGARPYYERALAIWETVLGSDHPSTAVALNNVGSLLRSMGDLTGARPYLERALQIDEKTFGPDHPGTAASLNNLGSLFQDMGDLASARPYMERVLAIREKALGPNHPDTAVGLNNLGTLLRTMGDLGGARPLMERALAIREKTLGSNHPDTAISLNNLGGLLYAMGDLARARPYYERALSIYEKALGPNHPSTAQSLNNLGFVLTSMGDLAGARPFFEQALAIREKTLGSTHPSTAASLNNLGNLLQAIGDSANARPYFERALAIQEKSLGPDHPDVANSLDNIGSLLRQMDDLSAARPYFERALAIREKALGTNHPYVATSQTNLGDLLRLSGELVNARNLFERALAIREKSLGPNHPDVAATLNNLGLVSLDMQDATVAHEYLSRSLKIIEARLGANHPSTQAIKQNLSLISGSGAGASGEGATAIGARGVFIGGNVQGSIITGDSNVVLQAGREISPSASRESINEYSWTFVRNISLTHEQLAEANRVVEELRHNISNFKAIQDAYSDIIMYGSFARGTAIAPLADVDILLLLKINPLKEQPRIAADIVRELLTRVYSRNQLIDARKARQARSFGASTIVQLPNRLRLEVTPAVLSPRDSTEFLIPDWNLRQWVPSNHDKHAAVARQFDQQTNGQFTALVKIFKYWYLNTHRIRFLHSFVAECLVAANFEPTSDNLLGAFEDLINRLQTRYPSAEQLRRIPVMGVDNETKPTAIGVRQYQNLMAAINITLQEIKNAQEVQSLEAQVEIWRKIFGSKFPEKLKDR